MKTDRLLPYFLILPTIIYLLIFVFAPLSKAVGLAFLTDEGRFTLGYFERMFSDGRFLEALKYTFLLTITIVPLQLITALLIALLINTRFKGSQLFLYICALPLGIADLAAGLILLSIFTQHGHLNSILYHLGFIEKPFYFISYQHMGFVFLSIVLAEHWRATAIVLVILVAGLQMISKDLLEAADVLGAKPWQKLWHVILPLLKPSLQSALIIRTIFALQMFAVVLALGGEIIPVLAGEAYFWYYIYRNNHISAAYALLLMVISILMTWIYLRFLRTRSEMRA
ncbi:sugar ABC transporter permease [candidate division WOR-3 bacterium]|uniref:Sugar ABC transporter permease n=1 Tax=candidate division WOR-3 bacterium TaxID=2052148 RepID=A0A660SGN4_UNCW3|nr:MAG: sugar ABC transporter permease [candidate division WOR-3 bacterium]